MDYNRLKYVVLLIVCWCVGLVCHWFSYNDLWSPDW